MECVSTSSAGRSKDGATAVALQHQELWKELLAMNERLNIHWRWIRGHSGHPVQTRVDVLAYQAARSHYAQQKVAA
jgi:ribonuclease HI